MTVGLPRPFSDRRFRRLVWLLIGSLGWIGLIALGFYLAGLHPPRAGDDLNLILDAGRRVAAGHSPYLATAVQAGTQVESLFYSYPPPVAQLAALLGSLPDATVLALLGVLVTIGFGVVVAAFGSRGAAAQAVIDLVLPPLALAPFIYPFAIALLFGNVDAWFPLTYGAVLLAVTGEPGASGVARGAGRWPIAAGIALGLMTVAKLHPGLLLVWLAVAGLRTWRDDRPAGPVGAGWPAAWLVVGGAIVTMIVVAAVSLVVGGTGPWADYIDVLRAGAGVDLVTNLNIGPASQLALLIGDPAFAGRVAPVIAVVAVLVTAAVAWFLRRTMLSLAIAACASLIVSPITWFHYPVALMPFAVAAWASARGTNRAGRSAALIAGAIVIATFSIVMPVLLWFSVALVVGLAAVGSTEGAALTAEPA